MLKLVSDENFNGDIIRGLFLRQPNLNLVRVQDIGLRTIDDVSRFAPIQNSELKIRLEKFGGKKIYTPNFSQN